MYLIYKKILILYLSNQIHQRKEIKINLKKRLIKNKYNKNHQKNKKKNMLKQILLNNLYLRIKMNKMIKNNQDFKIQKKLI